MEKRKKSKLTILACLALLAAIVCGIAALTLGAASKDSWISASKRLRVAQGMHETPVARSISLSAQDVFKLNLDLNGGNMTVKYYDGEEVLVEYYEDYADEVVASVNGDMLVIDRNFYYGSLVYFDSNNSKFLLSTGAEWLIYEDYLDINLSLPRGLSFNSADIDISGGKASIDGIVLGGTKIDVSGGAAEFNDCEFGLIEKINISGGYAKLTNCTLDSVGKIDVSGGYAELKNCPTDRIAKIDISGGKATLTNCSPNSIGKIDVSGGDVAVSGSALSGETEIDISGGAVRLNELDANPSDIAFDVDTSGGSVYFNGSKIHDGRYGTVPAVCLFKVDISGGVFSVTTK